MLMNDAGSSTSRDFDGSTYYLAGESDKFGLKFNFPKTKIMAVTRKFGSLQQAVLGEL